MLSENSERQSKRRTLTVLLGNQCPILANLEINHRTATMAAFDAVDGSHPTASQYAKLVVSMNHGETGAVHERSYHDWC